MRESFKKSESQAFTDPPQTAMKEFMAFNTNSDILPHIIEQALRQSIISSVMSSYSHPDILLFMTTLALQITNSEGLRL